MELSISDLISKGASFYEERGMRYAKTRDGKTFRQCDKPLKVGMFFVEQDPMMEDLLHYARAILHRLQKEGKAGATITIVDPKDEKFVVTIRNQEVLNG